jgi:hypothetical protein
LESFRHLPYFHGEVDAGLLIDLQAQAAPNQFAKAGRFRGQRVIARRKQGDNVVPAAVAYRFVRQIGRDIGSCQPGIGDGRARGIQNGTTQFGRRHLRHARHARCAD